MKLLDTLRRSPLVLISALVQACAFALAGSVYLGRFGWVIGAGAGITINLSMAFASSRISGIAKERRALAWGAFAVLFLLSPIAVAPAEYLLIAGKFPAWLCVTVALVWSILPDAAIIAAGGVAGKSLVATEQAQAIPQSQQAKPKRSKAAAKALPCPHCRGLFSQSGLNAHVAYCKDNPLRRSKFSVMIPVERETK